MNWFGLGFLLQAKDQTGPAFGSAQQNLDKLRGAATAAQKAVGSFILQRGFRAGLGFLEGAFDMTDDARKFELTMAQLRVISHATADEMKAFRAGAIDSGIETMHGPQEAADVMKQLAQNGFSASKALTMSRDALRLLTASGGEISKATDAAQILSMAQKAFGVDSEKAVDQLAMISNLTSASFGEMGTMISHFMRGTGMEPPMEEALALAGLARNLSSNMESASTAVGVLMERFQNVKKMKPFEEMGVQIFDKLTNKFKGPVEIMQALFNNPNWNKLDARVQTNLLAAGFGSRQQGAINAIMKQMKTGVDVVGVGFVKGGAVLDAYLQKLRNATKEGAANEFIRAVEGTFEGAMKRLEALGQTMKIQLGEGLMEVFRPVLRILAQIGVVAATAFEGIPLQLRTWIARAVVFGAAMGTAILGVGALIMGFSFLAPILWELAVPLIAATAIVTTLTSLIVGAGAALYAAFSGNMFGFADQWRDLVGKIKLGFEVFKQLMEQGGTSGEVHNQIMDPKNRGVLDFMMTLWMWMNRIKVFASSMWEGFKEGLSEMGGPLATLQDALNEVLESFGLTAGSADANQGAFESFAAAGRSLGIVLAGLANVGIMLLVGAVEALISVVKAAHSFLDSIGYGGPTGTKVMAADAAFWANMVKGNFSKAKDAYREGQFQATMGEWTKLHPDINRQGTDEEFAQWVTENVDHDLIERALKMGRPKTPDMNSSLGPRPIMGAHPGLTAAQLQAGLGAIPMLKDQAPAPVNLQQTNIIQVTGDALEDAAFGISRNRQVRSYQLNPDRGM